MPGIEEKVLYKTFEPLGTDRSVKLPVYYNTRDDKLYYLVNTLLVDVEKYKSNLKKQ